MIILFKQNNVFLQTLCVWSKLKNLKIKFSLQRSKLTRGWPAHNHVRRLE